jgi:ankyrin repeat protein
MFDRIINKLKKRSNDEYGRSPLHYAIVDTDFTKVRKLLKSGHDVNAQDKKGWTPLHVAAEYNLKDIVQLLLDNGADVHLKDSWGNIPLARAINGYKGKDGSVIRLLLEAGSDPFQCNSYGVSPFSTAQSIANYDVKKFFENCEEGKP